MRKLTISAMAVAVTTVVAAAWQLTVPSVAAQASLLGCQCSALTRISPASDPFGKYMAHCQCGSQSCVASYADSPAQPNGGGGTSTTALVCRG